MKNITPPTLHASALLVRRNKALFRRAVKDIGGFTGKITDSLNRIRCYNSGTQVACGQGKTGAAQTAAPAAQQPAPQPPQIQPVPQLARSEQKPQLKETSAPEEEARRLHEEISDDDMLALVGLGGEGTIDYRGDVYYDEDIIRGGAWGFVAEFVHPQLDSCRRFIGVDSDGRKFIKNDVFIVNKAYRKHGVGARVFSQQVATAADQGFAYITCQAAGRGDADSSMNGYYTWPRLGYNESVESIDSMLPRVAEAIRAKYPDAESVLDVMATQEGRDWWKIHGEDLYHAKFDLVDDSRSLEVLAAYLEERVAKGKQKRLSGYQTKSNTGFVEKRDRRNRRYCLDNGIHVPCPENAAEHHTGSTQRIPQRGGTRRRIAEQRTRPRHPELVSKFVGEIVGHAEHAYAAHVESEVADAVGGINLEDNEPLDVRVLRGDREHAIEVKSLLKGAKQSISVHPDALVRKVDYVQTHPNAVYHTVVIDDRVSYDNGAHAAGFSGHRLYYKRGCGRYSLSRMHAVASLSELKELIDAPDDALPENARGALPVGETLTRLRELAERAHAARLQKDRTRKARLKAAGSSAYERQT